MYRAAAVGAYPSDSYFDPGRPGWMPYWLDSPSESAMKWGLYPPVAPLKVPNEQIYLTPPRPTAPGAPNDLTSPPADAPDANATIDAVLRSAWSQTIKSQKDFFDAEWENIQAQKPKDGLGFGWVWLVVAGLGLLILVKR